MNCSQARTQLAAYRELKNTYMDTTELDVHLEHCVDCRKVLAQTSFISERLKALPTIEPTSDARAKMMQALAAEHTRFIQNSPTTAPPPDFLKPYIQQQTQSSHQHEALAAFTTAETGPLPVLQARRKYHRTPRLNQFAVIGLAATFLLLLMTGGLAGLIAFANRGVPNIPAVVSINQPAQIAMARYSAITNYTHVVSAIADHEHIYYTAYGDGNNGWMLGKVNSADQIENNMSTPLLESASSSPLIVLDSSENWVVWLQFDQAKAITNKRSPASGQRLERTWTLSALPIGSSQSFEKDTFATPITLLTGTFDEGTAPDWTHTPIQGIWMSQNTLMIAMLDNKGTSHLLRGQLDSGHGFMSTELASAKDGRVLTSPTSNGDGSLLYWAEEWMDTNQNMHSNIWTQETLDASPTRGRWYLHKVINTYLLRADEQSFHPQIVNDTLFFLSTANDVNTSTTQATPQTKKSVEATPTSATTDNTQFPIVNRVDQNTYPSQADSTIHGTLLALPQSNNALSPIIFSDSSASALQGGGTFILWQSDKGYEMYDVVARSTVTVSQVPAGANFLAVNGGTAIWTDNTDKATDPVVTFREFQWPNK